MAEDGQASQEALSSGKVSAFCSVVQVMADLLSSLVGLVFLAMLLLVVAQIVFRFALQISVPWTEDVGRLLFVYVVYLGASVAFHERGMIVIDTVPAIWPGLSQITALLAALLTFLITAFMFYASIPMVRSSWNTSLPTVNWISNGWAYLAFTISFGLMLLHSLAHLVMWTFIRRSAA